ncbi:rCG22445, partial [Rattus norvegicus]
MQAENEGLVSNLNRVKKQELEVNPKGKPPSAGGVAKCSVKLCFGSKATPR